MAVRNESVRLTLDDAGFSTGMVKAAAATALLERNLDDLDGTNVGAGRNLAATSREVDSFSGSLRRSDSDLNQFTGRLGLWRDAILTIGPGLIPIAAVGIPAVTGLASAFGFAAVGAGTAVVAFQGVGTALESMRKAQLEPTAANLAAARLAMEQIGPPAREFVRELLEMGPALRAVRDAAAAGLFSELTPALDDMEAALPRVASLFETVGEAVGGLGADAIESLTGPEWVDFFEFIEAEAPQAMADLGHAVGSVAHGFSELWEAFGPLNRDFNSWLVDAAQGFEDWASGLSQTEGFEGFVDYIRTNGPKVADAVVAISNALVQVTQAAAPLGGPVLEAITGFANAIATLADSPLGTPLFTIAAGLAAVSRSAKLLGGASLGMAGLTTSLTTLATKGPAVILALGSVNDAMERWDSINRSRETENTFAGDVQELADQLSKSNVGKYAQDLGIDLERLAVDLAENGKSGEYASSVLDQLRDSSEGAGNNLEIFGSHILPLFTANADKAWEANSDLNQVISNMGAGSLLNVFPGLSAGFAGLSGGADDSADSLRAAADAAESFSDSLANLSGWLSKQEALRNYQVALNDLRRGLKDGFQPKDVDNVLNFGRAVEQVASQMGKQGRADFLAPAIGALEDFSKRGPKAAEAIQPLLNQLRKLADSSNLPPPKLDADGKPLEQKVDRARGLLKGLAGAKTVPKADLDDAPFKGKEKGVRGDLLTLGRITESPTVSLTDHASGPLSSIRGQLTALDGFVARVGIHTVRTYSGGGRDTAGGPQVATGGHIIGPGTGTSDSIPAWLSNGEFVVNAAATARHLSLLHQINAENFAIGGVAGRTPDFGIGTALRMGPANDEIGRFTGGLKKARNALEREVEQRKELIADKKAFASEVAGSFDNDIFGNGLAGLRLQLSADANDARAMRRALQRAERKGLSGGLFNELAASGDLTTAQQIDDLSRREIRRLERQFGATTKAQQQLGNFAASERYDKAVRDQTKEIKHLRRVIDRLDGKVEKGVERGAHNGTRKGNDQRDRHAAQRGRVNR